MGLTKKVSLDNKGQITRYPYILDEDDLKKLDIANTHQQWHQLDMDDPDFVVWYNLSDDSATETGIYSSRENDARNQYYIYNVEILPTLVWDIPVIKKHFRTVK